MICTSIETYCRHDYYCFKIFLARFFVSEGKAQCEVCLKQVHPRGLARHTRLVHGKLHMVACNLCDKQFKSSDYLKDHLRRHHLVYQT